ncbi:TonB-dependent receptor [Paraflavisolibacter sp. H34]|uniref:TonB-dependent receptor n=1 Tax=Huijunlia imazamoxiresistens TaxID=3127457 RepID=UPI003019F7C0
MKRIVLSLLLLPFVAAAQTRTVTGTVKDAANNEPVADCSIVLENGGGTRTGKNGTFSLTLPPGATRLLASHTGYHTDTLLLKAQGSAYTVFLEPSTNNLDEVVVSGTMKAVTRLSSPIPVEVYSPQFFRKNPAPALFEALNMVTGVQPQINCNVCNTGDIHINGLEGPYTMILIDGMPIVSSLATVYGLHGIPQSIIKRVEVVKGPASTLYGSEAVAGLVNVMTKDPSDAHKLSVDLMATSIGELNTDISTRWSAGKKASALLGVNHFHYWTPQDINHDNFTDVTQQQRLSLFNKWSFERKAGRKASLAARYVTENRWGGELQWNKSWRGSDSIYGESISTDRLEVIGTYDLPLREKIRLDYSYNFHHQDSYYGTTKYDALQHTAFTQLVWDGRLGSSSLLAGIPLRYIWYDDNSIATADSTAKKNKPSATWLPGIFVQNEVTFGSGLTVLTGLRYDYNSIHGGIVTPRLSFKYALHPRHTLRLTGGSGYRVVNLFTEDHAALSGAREVVVEEQLKPEQSWNVNANYNGWWKGDRATLSLDASLFYTYFTNQIIADYLTDPRKIIYGNLDGHAVSRGATINAELSFPKGLKLVTGATLMNVYRKERTDGHRTKMPQLFAPRFSGNFALSYNFRKAGLTADLTGKVMGPMHLPTVPDDFRPEQSPWHCLMNLQLTKRLPHNLEVFAGAKNLLNFIPKDPILRPYDPFNNFVNDKVNNPYGYTFDPSYNYAPIQGIKGFLGVRWTVK